MKSARPLARLLALATLGCAVVPVFAQSGGFDMSPESDLRTAPPTTQSPSVVAPPVVQAPPAFSRNIVPNRLFQLLGEDARRSVNVYLTSAQAAAKATLELGYLNAVVVAPEASTLAVIINGTSVLAQPIASSATDGRLHAEIPPGILRAGANTIEFDASQRHRTDCSVQSTYELWTQIDPTATQLRFEGTGLGQIAQLSEIAAVGFDPTGITSIRFVAPGVGTANVDDLALNLVQQLALALRVPELNISFVDTLPENTPEGSLNVILATANELPDQMSRMQPQAAAGPMAAFAPLAVAPNTLVISGPDWNSVVAATRAVAEVAATPANPAFLPQRVDLADPIPRVDGATTIALSDLGVRTVEFNGRRYTTSFEFSLPSDFYAQMYGEAYLMLDAAYSAEVLPGSQFDVYANGQIASATPVLRTDGGLFRNTQIKIPMTHFRPGRNQIDTEVILQTDADARCAPGLTQSAPDRFLFSASTQLVIPDFARAAALPDLQATVGTGAPYTGEQPVSLVLGAGQQTLPAAMTWLARMAVSAGVAVPVKVVSDAQVLPSENAIVVAPLGSMPEGLFRRSGVARAASGSSDASILDQFTQNLGATNSNPFDTARRWIADAVGLAPENLNLFGRPDEIYLPQSNDAAVVAQSVQPEGGVWTYVTMPNDANFLSGVQRLTQRDNWRAIAGRVSALGPGDGQVIAVEPGTYHLVETQPFSLFNLRLVFANWVSTNVLQFALLLAGIATILTLVTALLLRSLGRNSS